MKTRTLLLDNFDSFTYNLYHHLRYLGEDVQVVRNNDDSWKDFEGSHIVLSPGPGLPKTSGYLMECLEHFHGKLPILGVCLGHQAIAEYKGMKLFNLPDVRHGLQLKVEVAERIQLFKNSPDSFDAGFYHSWAVEKGDSNLSVTANDNENVIMALENPDEGLFGIQFHPESIMCSQGMDILKNFLAFS
jgi:anthranilate synthase component 2